MGERGADMQHRTAGKNRTPVTAVRTGPQWYALYPVKYLKGMCTTCGVILHIAAQRVAVEIENQQEHVQNTESYNHDLFEKCARTRGIF